MLDHQRFSWKILLALLAALFFLLVILLFGSQLVAAIASSATSNLVFDYLVDAFNGPVFYIRPDGDDSASGRTPYQAWRSIEQLNQNDFEPGNHILFLGGQRFEGSLLLDETDCGSGSAETPTVIGSYGEGRATIAAGDNYVILIHNCDHVLVKDLILAGSGAANTQNGLEILNDLPGETLLSGIEVDGLEVSGFRHGIRLRAANGLSGFSQVRLTNNQAHHNLHSGISSNWDAFDNTLEGWPFQDVYVAHNVAHHNTGDPAFTDGHSGNGIVIGSVEGAVIEHNFVYDNGALNAAPYQGPVGLWAWDCKRTIIQYNESFGNKSGTDSDGGGFDLDGGCQDSIMQYNVSHDNDGAGFMVGQFDGARPMSDIALRYNLSVNDARRNRHGGVYLFRVEGTEMHGIDVYQNTVFVSPGPRHPAAFRVANWTTGIEEVRILNNAFITSGEAWFVDIEQPGNDVRFWGNNYDSSEGSFVIRYAGEDYYALSDWRTATGQERYEGVETGKSLPSSLTNSGGSSPSDYQLRGESGLVDGGLDLGRYFVPDAGARDFFGNLIPARSTYDIGMHESR